MPAEKLVMLSACLFMQWLYIIIGLYLKLLESEESLLHHLISMSTVYISSMADAILIGEIKCCKSNFSGTLG